MVPSTRQTVRSGSAFRANVTSRFVAALLTCGGFLPAAVVLAQTGDGELARTPWGHPDLQGIWDYRSTTPFERPEELGTTAVVTGEARTSFLELVNRNYRQFQDGFLGADWSDHFDNGLAAGGRTSLIVDPLHGRLPPRTPRAVEKRAERVARWSSPHGPEDRLLTERCLLYKSAPLGWSGDNNNVHILQIPDAVALVHEMIHEAVIVPLDGRPHLPSQIRLWRGDARGYWEGDTLVVETTNRHMQWASRNGMFPTPNMRVVERFTRICQRSLRTAEI